MSSLRDRVSHGGFEAGAMRRTLKSAIGCVGAGLHSGTKVRLNLRPAASGTGIIFHRTDLGVRIPALYDYVTDTKLCTVVSLPGDAQARVGTIEHLMAAISASGIDDLVIEIDAPELPILDGSAAPFMFLIQSAGIVEQAGRRDVIEILRPVRAEQNEAFAELRPHKNYAASGFDLSLSIDFSAPVIGQQFFNLSLTCEKFGEQLASARTFAMAAEIAALRKAGLAKGGSLNNAIVVDDHKILNPAGLRWEDEFVRHKLLDVVGDLALAGAAFCGSFVGHRTGHGLNNQLLRNLFSNAANYRISQSGFAGINSLQAVAA